MRAVLMAGTYPMVGRLLPANKGRRPVVETASGVKVRLHPRSCNFNLSFSESSRNPLVIYDEIIRGDHGMYINNSSIAGSYPLLLLSTEMVVAPSDDSDEEEEDSSEDEAEKKSSVQHKEEIMSSPDTIVTVIVDRWLRFNAMALDVAQIYCLRERLASAILFKVR
jgi:ATP-dependent RNA helicase DHX36